MATTSLFSPREKNQVLGDFIQLGNAHVSTRRRFQTGLIFNLLGAVFNQGSTFAVNLVLARVFDRSLFGEYAMVLSTIAAIALLAQFGIPYTLNKYVSEYRSSDPERAGRIFGVLAVLSFALATFSAAILLMAARWLATSVMNSSLLIVPCALSAAVVFFTVLNGFGMAALSGLERYRTLATVLVWSGITYFVVCAALGCWLGLNGAVAGLALSALIQFVLLARAVRTECSHQKITLSFCGFSREKDALVKFALPAGLTGFSSSPALWLPNAFLVRQPDGYSQMAIYSVAFSMMTMILFLPNIANTVGTSLINHHKGTGQAEAYRRTFWANLLVISSIVIVGSGCLALLGPWVLRLFGRDFRDGYSVLLILLLATIPQGLSLGNYQIIQSHAKMWASFLGVAIPRDLLTIGLAFRLIPAYGARGLAVAYTVSWTLAFGITVLLVSHIGIAPIRSAEVLAEVKP
jgi:O-antigen/teichoic acid export membrane protein